MDPLSTAIRTAYDTIVCWQANIFKLPSCSTSKLFIDELARLFDAFTNKSTIEGYAIKAAMTLPALLLQKPFKKSKVRDHVRCLGWDLWRKGSIDKLIKEGEVIQKHISMSSRRPKYNSAANFSSLMRQGKVKQAIRIITDSNQKGPLDLDAIDPSGDSIRRILLDKHPVSQPLSTDCICEPSADLSNNFHPILFEAITSDTIKSAAINTHGCCWPFWGGCMVLHGGGFAVPSEIHHKISVWQWQPSAED